jgi:hypothetical protein
MAERAWGGLVFGPGGSRPPHPVNRLRPRRPQRCRVRLRDLPGDLRKALRREGCAGWLEDPDAEPVGHTGTNPADLVQGALGHPAPAPGEGERAGHQRRRLRLPFSPGF